MEKSTVKSDCATGKEERPASEGGPYESKPRRRRKAAPTRGREEHRLKPVLPVAGIIARVCGVW
jgi:hypothetical protein